jgi:hypothetical protein
MVAEDWKEKVDSSSGTYHWKEELNTDRVQRRHWSVDVVEHQLS